MTGSWRTWILFGAAALIAFALVRRDWAHQRPVHERTSLGQNHASIDIGLRDYHEHGPYEDRIEPLHGLFLVGTRIEGPARGMFETGLLALVVCLVAGELFRREKLKWVARIVFAMLVGAAFTMLLVFWAALDEGYLVELHVGACPYVMLAGLSAAIAALAWPRSSRSRSPAEPLPQARALAS